MVLAKNEYCIYSCLFSGIYYYYSTLKPDNAVKTKINFYIEDKLNFTIPLKVNIFYLEIECYTICYLRAIQTKR